MKVDNEPEITIIRKTRTVRNKHKQLPSLSQFWIVEQARDRTPA